MPTITADHPTLPAPAENGAEDDRQRTRENPAQALPQRWPIPLNLRGAIIKLALGICGLKVTADGQVQETDEEPPPSPRDKLAAMRIIASYDKLSIDERKLDLREYPSGEKPVPKKVDDRVVSSETATKCQWLLAKSDELLRGKPKPPVDPHVEEEIALELSMLDARWPISEEIRRAMVTSAAALCGLSITGEGLVEPMPVSDETPAPERRIVLGALRVLARFDRLSIEHRRVELRRKQYLVKNPEFTPNVVPEIAAEIHALTEEDAQKHRDPNYVEPPFLDIGDWEQEMEARWQKWLEGPDAWSGRYGPA